MWVSDTTKLLPLVLSVGSLIVIHELLIPGGNSADTLRVLSAGGGKICTLKLLLTAGFASAVKVRDHTVGITGGGTEGSLHLLDDSLEHSADHNCGLGTLGRLVSVSPPLLSWTLRVG